VGNKIFIEFNYSWLNYIYDEKDRERDIELKQKYKFVSIYI